jgi:hypothetical protein
MSADGSVLFGRDEPIAGVPFFDSVPGHLIVASYDGTLSVIDQRTGATIRTIDTGVADAPAELWRENDRALLAAYWDRIRFIDDRTGEISNGPVPRLGRSRTPGPAWDR